jgi:hypothetical protein
MVKISTSITQPTVDTHGKLNADGRLTAVPIYVGGNNVVVATPMEHLFKTLKQLHDAEARHDIFRS